MCSWMVSSFSSRRMTSAGAVLAMVPSLARFVASYPPAARCGGAAAPNRRLSRAARPPTGGPPTGRAARDVLRRSRRASADRRRICPGLDGLDGGVERLDEVALADRPEEGAEQPPLQVLALADDRDVDAGRPVGLPGEVVRVARVTAPQVRVGRRQHDVVGIGPVVVQALPDAAGALGDVGIGEALVVDLQVVVGTVAEDLRAAGAEVRERRDELLRRRVRGLVEVDGGHVGALRWRWVVG